MTWASGPIKGRGVSAQPANRFESTRVERGPVPDEEWMGDDGDALPRDVRTEFLPDASRTIIARNDSPDVGFRASINPYRGCEHGCSYCYARPSHEYLGMSAGLDFESKIMVKHDAPGLLGRELSSPRWVPQTLGISGVTDCYQPVERKLRLTRRCLEVLAEFRNPVAMVTKNALVARDADVLGDLARHEAAAVYVSVTTLDADLARVMEPRTSPPFRRLQTIRTLADAGVPVGVMVAPIVPGLNDHEIPAILGAAAQAGARTASYVLIRLPLAVAPIFEGWLTEHAPERKEKVLGRIRAMREGRLNNAAFGERMRGQGPIAEMIRQMFRVGMQRAGLAKEGPRLSTAAFRRPGETLQGTLFD